MYGLLLSHYGSSLNTSFVPPTIAKMADKWPQPIILLLWTLYLSHWLPDCFQISYMDYFYQTLTLVWMWALSANQDGLRNGRNLSVCTCGHYNLVIYRPISQVPTFKLISFIIHWPNFEYGFVRWTITKMAAKRDVNDQFVFVEITLVI